MRRPCAAARRHVEAAARALAAAAELGAEHRLLETVVREGPIDMIGSAPES